MKKYRILILDDDPAFSQILSDMLTENGYAPVMAATAPEAVAAVREEMADISVALIDLRLEDAFGLDVMKEIKDVSPHTECIILTGHTSQETVIEAMDLGAYSYVQKSHELESMLLTIRRACDKRSAELALRESEEQYRSLASTSDSMYLVDSQCRYLFMNEGYRARRGVALEEIIGRTYGEFHSREQTETFALKVATVFETGSPIQYESTAGDGEFFLKTLSPVTDHNGKTRAVTTASKNVTAQKRVEEALRESEARYRSVFEGTNTATLIVEENDIISMVNTAFEELSGYSKKEVEGRMSWVDFVNPQDIDRMKGYHEKRMQGKRGAPREYEASIINKEGDVREILLTVGVIPGTKRSVCSLMDITESKRAEAALRETEERYRALFDNNPVETIIVDREARVTGYNLAKKLSGGRLPAINRDIMYRDYASRHKTDMYGELRECIRSGISKEFLEQEYEDRFLDIKIAPFSEGAIITTVDATSRKRAESHRKNLETQLQHAQKMEAIGTLAGGLAHDFNNLLMGIQGNASLVLLDMEPDHPHYEKLRNIEQYVRDGGEITKQLLGFARGGKYEVKPTDLNKLGQKSADMFGRTRKEIKLYRKFQEDIWMVAADQGQIEQTLLNIFVNAWQAMPDGGEIYLETENVILGRDTVEPYDLEPGKYVKISITDTGKGMDAETVKRVFDPFFTTKEMGRGTGLGLASAYGIIKNHNGMITVYSEEGIGTTFNIFLPVLDAVIEDQEPEIMEEEAVMGYETILLVDDEELIIDVGGDILKFLGYTVFLARSGKEAVEIYREHQGAIDLVILDMIMPDMGGGETYDILKKINPGIKVLLSSGYSINGQAREILEQGCDGFIQKPFSIEQLSKKIREILQQ